MIRFLEADLISKRDAPWRPYGKLLYRTLAIHIFVKRRILAIMVLTQLLFQAGPGFGQEESITINVIAVMPVGIHTVENESINFTGLFTDNLLKRGFSVVPHRDVDAFLVGNRIRRTDFLDRATIREMGAQMHADALMVGSVEVFSGGNNPKVAMSVSLIDCVDSSLIWANSVSYTGEDFSGILGIGKIDSMQRLAGVAVADLLAGVPAQVGARTGTVRPFEIVQANFFPKILKGGQSANLSIEVRKITQRPKDIKAFVFGSEVDLNTTDGRWYTGTVAAPRIEGVYPLRIYVADMDDRVARMDGLAQLKVDNTPPDVSVSLTQRIISPNNDGIMDNIPFFPELSRSESLESWRIEITDDQGGVVRSEEGMGSLPGGFVWSGDNDQYRTVRDGIYYCQLVLEDSAGNRSFSPKETIVVDATPPKPDLVIIAKNSKEMTLELTVEDITQIDDWELVVYDTARNKVCMFQGQKEIPHRLSCSLDSAPAAETAEEAGGAAFYYSLEVNDQAGNRLEKRFEALMSPQLEKSEQPGFEKVDVWVDDF